PHPEDSSSLSEVHSRIYRSSRSKNPFLLDTTKVKAQYTDLQCLQEIKVQRPKVHACSFLNNGPTRYLEIYVEFQHDVNYLDTKGVEFKESKLRIIPCQATDDSWIPRPEVLEGLKVSLSPFGQVIDVGIITKPNTGFFMGSGYAVIGTPRQSGEDQIKFQELAHNIRWREEKDEIFHATWNNMSTWCRYCHQTGHTKFECEKSKAPIICYHCHLLGHRSFECPRK
ncbi:uncharacterized protein B0P05DRAFT_448439, partial [Gilbertella persicaria]|uniref:uncharacterized protein n=1 Tax=Gilbertella persicaria TaxID=101096 RepID=UPI00221EF619